MIIKHMLMVIFALLAISNISVEAISAPLAHVDGAESYMHPDELMELVYGPIHGNAVWVWDTCFVRHSYFSALCLVSIVAIVAYEANSTVRENVNHILNFFADKIRGENAVIASKQDDVKKTQD